MTALELGDLREAREPPELRGEGRDDVALLVAHGGDGSLEHHRFRELPCLLREGDLLVVNTSGTLPAALPAALEGEALELHLSTELDDGTWAAELRRDREPFPAPAPGARVDLPGGARARVVAPYSARLAVYRLELNAPVADYLGRHGHPIRYRYVEEELPLDAYQTVFALEPGSAEMPSAGRPFTPQLVAELAARGILIAPITLHTGVSSLEAGEPPYPERFHVPEGTARIVNAVRWWRGRVIAVGTTVARALETAGGTGGTVHAAHGWTSLTITPDTGVRVVDGLLTGWHEPRSSHLQILEAVGGAELIERSYRAARARAYNSHEFGDLHLIFTV